MCRLDSFTNPSSSHAVHLKKGGGETHHRQQPPHGIARLGPNTKPVRTPTDIDLDILHLTVARLGADGELGDRVIGAQDLEGFGVARRLGVGEDDVVARVVAFGAAGGGDAGEAEAEDHRRCCCFCCCGAGGKGTKGVWSYDTVWARDIQMLRDAWTDSGGFGGECGSFSASIRFNYRLHRRMNFAAKQDHRWRLYR